MLIIFDKDSTLVESLGGRPANTVEEHRLLPNVLEKCTELKAAGHVLGIASNQGGVAFGYMTIDEAQAIMEHAAVLINADFYTFCPAHPKGKVKAFAYESLYRKPNPGMILELAQRAGVQNVAEILFVGDMDTDREAAVRAGVKFKWAKDFFGF
jgi:D-glycero-D-manno-heptose 1,7-bisphosphate phosphatase